MTQTTSTGMPTHDQHEADAYLLPASFSQEDWLDADGCNVWSCLAIDGPVDAAHILAALADVVARHESMRTALVVVDGKCVQRVQRSLRQLPVDVTDLQHVSSADAEAHLVEVSEHLLDVVLDQSQAPMWRGRLVRLGPGRHVLITIFQHAVFDGWSQAVLIAELRAHLNAAVSRTAPRIGDLPLQPGDFAAVERSLTPSAEQSDYWDELFPAQALAAPAMVDAPPTAESFVLLHTFGADLMQQTTSLAAHAGAGRASAARALVLAGLLPYTGQRLTYALVRSGRDDPRAKALIGNFADQAVAGVDLGGTLTFTDLALRMHHSARRAHDLFAPTGLVARHVSPSRWLPHHQLLDVVFNYMPQVAARTAPADQVSVAGMTLPIKPPTVPAARRAIGGVGLGLQLHHTPSGDLNVGAWVLRPRFSDRTLEALGAAQRAVDEALRRDLEVDLRSI